MARRLDRHGVSERRAALLALFIVGWFALNLWTGSTRLMTYSPTLHAGVEAAGAFARLFGALVLFLVSGDPERPRLRWVAAAFLALGLGGFTFGYLLPLFDATLPISAALLASRVVWLLASALILAGMLPAEPRAVSLVRLALAVVVAIAVLAGLLLVLGAPGLVGPGDLGEAAGRRELVLEGTTAWYWVCSLVPLGATIAAVLAVARAGAVDALQGRLLVALVLFAGAQLHDALWPSAYVPVLTGADVLELIFAGAVAVAGVVELRRLADERSALLARERLHVQALRQLAVLKSDFTAVVAHELGNPVSAIRRQADLIARDGLDPTQRTAAVHAIQAEAKLMAKLVRDVQESAAVERVDFEVTPRPYPVAALLDEAAAFARALPGGHPISVDGATGRVLADPDRIGQVLRNLLGNAASYAEAGTPIALRAAHDGTGVRIAIEDHGPGIAPGEVERIFEKFGRGAGGRERPGLGLGLYVARRIVAAHGSTIEVRSAPGEGATFSFTLEVAP